MAFQPKKNITKRVMQQFVKLREKNIVPDLGNVASVIFNSCEMDLYDFMDYVIHNQKEYKEHLLPRYTEYKKFYRIS